MDVSLSSCYLGLRKRSWRSISGARYSRQAGGAGLFIDDRAENVAAAVGAG